MTDTAGVVGAKLYVIGGPSAGLSALQGEGASAALAAEKLQERCAFLNSEDVIKQFQY
jgi:hypothetical protein